jgi:hypothetical protein
MVPVLLPYFDPPLVLDCLHSGLMADLPVVTIPIIAAPLLHFGAPRMAGRRIIHPANAAKVANPGN